MQSTESNGQHRTGSSSHGTAVNQESITRPFTLREALPYCPQTTTLPFLPEIVLNPILGFGSPALDTRGLLPHNLDELNQEARAQGSLTRDGKQAADNVLHELKVSQRTLYKFPSMPRGHSSSTPQSSISQSLPPVAKAIFERVGGYFKSTKVHASDQTVTNGVSKHQKPKPKEEQTSRPPPVTPKPQVIARNVEAHISNSGKMVVAIPSKRHMDELSYNNAHSSPVPLSQDAAAKVLAVPNLPLPQTNQAAIQPTSESGKPEFRVEFPKTNINRAEYLEVAETLDLPQDVSQKKKARAALANGHDVVGESLDQRQRSDAALEELSRRTRVVSRAVRATMEMEPGFEQIVYLTSEEEAAMTADEQKKVHNAIHKVMTLGCLHRVPIQDLVQILRLSEPSLKAAISCELQVDKEWDESAIESWLPQLTTLDTALKAARTCSRILSGGREDKQLYSESIIENIVQAFKKAIEDVIVPLVELRSSGPTSSIFKLLSRQKKDISVVFISCQKLLFLLAELVAKVQVSDVVLNTLEFVASNLIFVENAYTDKDSVIGVQKFDGIRSAAMDMLCQIFLIKPEQRQGIINEILTSLSKLPGSKQSSRQFKLSDGGSIQPVSALIMRLVQASSCKPDSVKSKGRKAVTRHLNGSGEDEDGDELQNSRGVERDHYTISNEQQGADQEDLALQELGAVSQELSEEAHRNASLVIGFLVQRAIGSSKSGETPFRNLLDLCVDDFTTCLDSTDWPAAELLLRCLMLSMVSLFEADKTAVPTKNMALEILGNMSAAISRLRSQVKKMTNTVEGSEIDELTRFLVDLANQSLDKESRFEQVLAWSGPYRVILESLQARSGESHLVNAAAFLITTWAARLRSSYDNAQDDDDERDREVGRMAYRLRMMIEDRAWLTNQYEFRASPPEQTKKLAFFIILLGSPLCESFHRMLHILLRSMSSDQASVRSKSLKSVNQVLETDPSILDGEFSVIERILESVTDMSPQVRESALSLLGNCMNMRRGLESRLASHIMGRVSDSGVAVRRRAMKLARDIYLRNEDTKLRSEIAAGLLRRVVSDVDEGVRETGRQIIEEIWFEPFYKVEDTATSQKSLVEHTMLMIKTVNTAGLADMLDKVFQSMLKAEKKGPIGPFDVSARLVATMFNLLNSTDQDDPDVPNGLSILQVLTIFARAEPKLFNFEQIRHLKPHIAVSDWNELDEVATFRAVVTIFKLVLPQLSSVHSDFVLETRKQLVTVIGKTRAAALSELTACLRVICDILKDVGPIKAVTKSSLDGLTKAGKQMAGGGARQACAYMAILGAIIQSFDLDPEIKFFKSFYKDFEGNTVARLVVDKLLVFTAANQPPDVRKEAIDSIAAVCQAWPRNFTLPKVGMVFEQAFKQRVRPLESTVLRSLKEFLVREEKRSEASNAAGGNEKEKKSLTVMGGTSYDDVASAMTQKFLSDITRIALGSQDPHALLALQVLGSINRQGLTHPKETIVTLVTLETSTFPAISELAFQEHKALHEKHESTLETQYSKAVQAAYEYQRDTVENTNGVTFDPIQAKLHNIMHVLKISKLKKRQRFLEKLIDLMDFEPAKLQCNQEMPPHLDFSRFILENLAAFDYTAVGDLQSLVHRMEKLITATGTTVAQAIDSELFSLGIDALEGEAQQQPQESGEPRAQQILAYNTSILPERLRQLATASLILLMVWDVRTYLRRLYGMGSHRHDSKAKALAKDLSKAPSKTQGVHWDKFWEEFSAHLTGLATQELMVQQCKAFVEVMNVDKEFKLAEEEDEMDLDAPGTPSDGDGDEEGGDRGRKRKAPNTPGGRKKRARSDSQPRKRGRPRKNPEVVKDAEGDADWL